MSKICETFSTISPQLLPFVFHRVERTVSTVGEVVSEAVSHFWGECSLDTNDRQASTSPSRTVVIGGRVLNIFTGEVAPADIAIEDGRIAAIVPPGELRDAADGDTVVVDASDYIVAPGYVEPHTHLGLLAEPVRTLERLAATGTTTVVADTYSFMVTMSDEEFTDVLDRFQALPVCVRWFLAPHARSFIENEDELFRLERLEKFLQRPDVVAVGEFTRWPLVDQGDPDLLRKIARARSMGKRAEGHGAGASLKRLQRLVKHGITSDHEAITAEQVLERLRVGLYTMLRHSSLRPDLPELVAAVKGELAYTNRVMLTADGPTPSWIQTNGYMDYLVRVALEAGVEPTAAYRMATLNPAMYYGIEGDVGSIAPGRRADLLFLESLSNPTPTRVMAAGCIIAEDGAPVEPFTRIPWETYSGMERASGKAPDAAVFRTADTTDLPSLHMAHTVILRAAEDGAAAGEAPARAGVETLVQPVQVSLYDWEGRWMTRALVTGFVDRLGGLASSYSPAYQLMVMGQEPEDMALAAERVMERRGGMCLVEDGRVVWELPLERGGLFTERPWSDVVQALDEFEKLMRDRGYRHGELLYSMFFFGFDSLPDYRLTTCGIWDVRQHRVVRPPEVLEE